MHELRLNTLHMPTIASDALGTPRRYRALAQIRRCWNENNDALPSRIRKTRRNMLTTTVHAHSSRIG